MMTDPQVTLKKQTHPTDPNKVGISILLKVLSLSPLGLMEPGDRPSLSLSHSFISFHFIVHAVKSSDRQQESSAFCFTKSEGKTFVLHLTHTSSTITGQSIFNVEKMDFYTFLLFIYFLPSFQVLNLLLQFVSFFHCFHFIFVLFVSCYLLLLSTTATISIHF